MPRDVLEHEQLPPKAVSSLRREDLVDLFSDFLDSYLYAKSSQLETLRQDSFAQGPSVYSENQAFWNDIRAGELRDGSRVGLLNFVVTEWAPLSPGRFFTERAMEARERALTYYRYDQSEYLPLGKEEMILGGVGCVRLGSRVVQESHYVVLGATSTGVSHEGVPICIPERKADQIRDALRTRSAIACDLLGIVRHVPKSLSVFQYDHKIPRIAVFVEDHGELDSASRSPLVTVAIAYSGRSRRKYISHVGPSSEQKEWCYASFDPTSSSRSLDHAVEWMREFTGRYSGGEYPPILFDFDEVYDHFPKQVEVPISGLLERKLDVEAVVNQAWARGVQININGNVVMGDNFENISSSQIVNRSIATDLPELVDLSWQVQKIGSKKLVSKLKQFTDGATSSRNLTLGGWWELRSEILEHGDDCASPVRTITSELLGRYPLGRPEIVDRLIDLVHKSSGLDTAEFREFLECRNENSIWRRIARTSKFIAEFPETRRDVQVYRLLSKSALSQEREDEWVDICRLFELGAASSDSKKKGAVLLFEEMMADIRGARFAAAKAKLENISQILPSLEGELSRYVRQVCSSD